MLDRDHAELRKGALLDRFFRSRSASALSCGLGFPGLAADRARAYVFQHGTDETEGAEVPQGTEFWEYPSLDEASRAYDQLLAESSKAGEVVEVDSDEGIGDSETDGAEVRDRYSASDEDLQIDNEEVEDSGDAVS